MPRRSALRRWPALLSGAALAAAAALSPGEARADYPLPWKASDGVIAPGRTVASADDATSVLVNPALLPFMPDAELRWNWTWTDYLGVTPARGHAWTAAMPLWLFGTGLRVDAIDPPPFANPAIQRDYYWLRWGMGASLGETFSLGATLGWSFSTDPNLKGLTSLTIGAAYRPNPIVSIGVVARDLNQPSTSFIPRSYEGAVAVRPVFGQRRFELAISGALFEDPVKGLRWSPGATLAVDIPRIGRARGDVRLFDLDRTRYAMATLGLEVNIDRVEVSGGIMLGEAIAGPGPGFYAGAALHPFRAPGMVLPQRFVKVKINGTPGDRGHTRLLRKLWRYAQDPEIAGVALVVKAEPASSFAHAEELGDALRLLHAKGKKTLCFLEDAGGRSLYVCSQTDRIAMNPAGGLRFSGLSRSYFMLGGMAEKLGIKTDFVRIGAHKTAAEELTLSRSTPVARDDHQELLERIEQVFLRDVARGRGVPVVDLKQRLVKGPFIAREAKAAGLVDVLAYEDEIPRVAEEILGRSPRMADDAPERREPTYWGDAPKIAIVYLAGSMVDGESQDVPILGVKMAGSATIARALRRAREDKSVKAVVFRMETGGGSSLAADVILREAQLTAKVKPLIVSMGSAAASGGYYASMAGAPVFANRSTMTGSIGIFYGKADVSGLLKTLGAGVELHRTSSRADAETLYRPFTDDERAELGRKVKQFYDTFIGRVCEGRKMQPDEVDRVARGKVWTGEQALPLKLIDKLGGLREAIDEAKARSGAPDDSLIVEYPEEEDSLLGALLKIVGLSSAQKGLTAASWIPPLYLDIARAFAPFIAMDSGVPLALSEVGEESSAGGVLSPRAKDEDEPSPPPRGRAIELP